ncbi:MAG TPA: hypothetical protein VM101_08945 [Flavitalea sp.]|nr:hypothetical protein [Flavitalea sp.]
MSYNTQHSSTDFSYLVVLLLLAYVMNSAPKYIRQFRQTHENIKIQTPIPIKQVLKMGQYYTITPYVQAWVKLSAPVKSNFAVIANFKKVSFSLLP